MLTDSSFASTSEIWSGHFGMVEATGLITWRRSRHQSRDLRVEFNENYQLVQKLLVGDTQTDSTVISSASLPFFRESRLTGDILVALSWLVHVGNNSLIVREKTSLSMEWILGLEIVLHNTRQTWRAFNRKERNYRVAKYIVCNSTVTQFVSLDCTIRDPLKSSN
jgi:hypothetical protein